jgi:hypothetical protein
MVSKSESPDARPGTGMGLPIPSHRPEAVAQGRLLDGLPTQPIRATRELDPVGQRALSVSSESGVRGAHETDRSGLNERVSTALNLSSQEPSQAQGHIH